MSSELFNTLSGYSVGIPAIEVIDSNGNIVSNFLNLAGNVSANKVYANTYLYANGQPFTATPGGSNTQLQYNNNGALGGIPNVSWDGNILSLGNIDSLSIGGGLNGYVLSTDGAGTLNWTAGGGGGNGVPGGSNTQVQYNNQGLFGGEIGFTYNDVTNTLAVPNASVTATVTTANINVTQNANLWSIANLIITGGLPGYNLITDGAGQLSWASPNPGIPGGSNTQIQFNNAGSFGGLPQFTFNSGTNLLTVPSIRSNTSANFQGATNVNLGTVANINIAGGASGYILSTNGSGSLSWIAASSGSPGGSNTQVQFNNQGSFGGASTVTYNNSTNTFAIAGNLAANTFQIGSGSYEFCKSSVYFATTASTAPNQVLWFAPVANLLGVDFTIISTDNVGATRQTARISSAIYNGVVVFNEYAGLQINGGVGSFSVLYDSGGPSVQLVVTPDSSHQTSYKMLITEYIE